MTVVVDTREDFTIENFRRVALGGESVEIGPVARRVMGEAGRRSSPCSTRTGPPSSTASPRGPGSR